MANHCQNQWKQTFQALPDDPVKRAGWVGACKRVFALLFSKIPFALLSRNEKSHRSKLNAAPQLARTKVSKWARKIQLARTKVGQKNSEGSLSVLCDWKSCSRNYGFVAGVLEWLQIGLWIGNGELRMQRRANLFIINDKILLKRRPHFRYRSNCAWSSAAQNRIQEHLKNISFLKRFQFEHRHSQMESESWRAERGDRKDVDWTMCQCANACAYICAHSMHVHIEWMCQCVCIGKMCARANAAKQCVDPLYSPTVAKTVRIGDGTWGGMPINQTEWWPLYSTVQWYTVQLEHI